jgi:hypothetical protein
MRHQKKTRRTLKNKKSRGGSSLGSIFSQAVVPFGLLGLQQTYRKKRRGGRRTRRH